MEGAIPHTAKAGGFPCVDFYESIDKYKKILNIR